MFDFFQILPTTLLRMIYMKLSRSYYENVSLGDAKEMEGSRKVLFSCATQW